MGTFTAIMSPLLPRCSDSRWGSKQGEPGAGWDQETGPSVLSTCFSYSMGPILLGLKTKPSWCARVPSQGPLGPNSWQWDWTLPAWLAALEKSGFFLGSSHVAAWCVGHCQRQCGKEAVTYRGLLASEASLLSLQCLRGLSITCKGLWVPNQVASRWLGSIFRHLQ